MDVVAPLIPMSARPNASDVPAVYRGMAEYFAATFQNGERQLTSLLLSQYDPAAVPCGTDAAMLTKSTANTANNACPSSWTAMSCTCVTHSRAAATKEWLFRVTPVTTTPVTTAVPVSVDASVAVLEVSSIGQFTLPDEVRTFRLLGVPGDTSSKKPLSFDFDLTSLFTLDGTISLVLGATKNFVDKVEVANIDFANVAISEAFLPVSVTDVTLRNCGLTSLPAASTFMRWSQLTNLDLSENNLSTWYGGGTNEGSLDDGCTIVSLNLAGNAFTAIPSSLATLDTLRSLDFSRNPITNFTITTDLYERLTKLTTLSFNDIDTSSVTAESCQRQKRSLTFKTVHGVPFCVLAPAADANAVAASAHANSGASKPLMYIGIGGGIVVVILVIAFFIKQRRHGNFTRPKAFSRTFIQHESRSEHRGLPTIPLIESMHMRRSLSLHAEPLPLPIDARLLNDPMIITSRLDHNDVRLGDAIKQGGFGIVYSGVYRRQRIAIKMLQNDHAKNAKLVESFLKEIALMASLRHPRIVEYIGCVWDTVQNIAMVTELMDRGDLREVLQHFKRRDAPLTWVSHKTRLALHIAEGLQYLHTLSPKVIHRDLKSKNVLVNDTMDAKLTDFGISREGRFEQTHMTAGIGTSFWIAPEVLAGVRYDERADIFSFGVVLSELDTDDYPYCNDELDHGQQQGSDMGVGSILRKVLSGEMRPQFSPDCPQMIRALADRCLMADPAMRVSASEIVQYLAPIANATIELREKYLELKVEVQ